MYLGGEGLNSSYWAYLLSEYRAGFRLFPGGITVDGIENDWIYTV